MNVDYDVPGPGISESGKFRLASAEDGGAYRIGAYRQAAETNWKCAYVNNRVLNNEEGIGSNEVNAGGTSDL